MQDLYKEITIKNPIQVGFRGFRSDTGRFPRVQLRFRVLQVPCCTIDEVFVCSVGPYYWDLRQI